MFEINAYLSVADGDRLMDIVPNGPYLAISLILLLQGQFFGLPFGLLQGRFLLN